MTDETIPVEPSPTAEPSQAENELTRLRQALEEKSREAEANYDRALRAAAELDNVKKRTQREREEYIRFANESLLRAFEEKARLIDLLSTLAGEQGVRVMIGRENPVEEMRECSLVTATYTYHDRVLGILGVVGPKRMPYSKMIPLVDETARLVSQSLSRVRQELYLPS